MPKYNKQFYLDQQTDSKKAAEEIVPIILDIIHPQSVVDVGCGVGTWLAVFEKRGINNYLGVDGNWVNRQLLQIPESKFLYHDLSTPVKLNKQFELAISLEVAEHLNGEFAEIFIESLVNLSPVIVFSAAIPYQGGQHHVNEQWPNYWAELFAKHNYVAFDLIRPRIWVNNNVKYWYAQNILIYVDKKSLSKYPSLEQDCQRAIIDQLSIVHPNAYLAKAQPSEIGNLPLKQLILSLFFAIKIKMRYLRKRLL